MSYNQRNMGFGGGISAMPPMIKTLLITNAIIFILEGFVFPMLTFGGLRFDILFENLFALSPLDNGFLPWQLISYQFMHEGFMHIFFNMFTLWMFGNEIEEALGSKKFLIYYLACGIGAGLIQLTIMEFAPGLAPPFKTVGASGSIMGVMLAFALYNPNRTIFIFPLPIPIKAIYMIIGIVVLDFLGAFTPSNVAHFAHLGGALTGFIMIKFLGFKNNPYSNQDYDSYGTGYGNWGRVNTYESQEQKVHKVNWFTRDEMNVPEPPKPPTPKAATFIIDGEEITQTKIDSILDKISASGYESLTEREKYILLELSKKIK